MPECHKCPYNGKGSDKCLTCGGPPETNHKGASHISVDSGVDEQNLGEVEASLQVWRKSKSPLPTLPGIHPDAVKVAVVMLELDEQEFRLVRSLLRDKLTMAAIGRAEGITRAAISARLKKLVGKHPVFSFLRGGKG